MIFIIVPIMAIVLFWIHLKKSPKSNSTWIYTKIIVSISPFYDSKTKWSFYITSISFLFSKMRNNEGNSIIVHCWGEFILKIDYNNQFQIQTYFNELLSNFFLYRIFSVIKNTFKKTIIIFSESHNHSKGHWCLQWSFRSYLRFCP